MTIMKTGRMAPVDASRETVGGNVMPDTKLIRKSLCKSKLNRILRIQREVDKCVFLMDGVSLKSRFLRRSLAQRSGAVAIFPVGLDGRMGIWVRRVNDSLDLGLGNPVVAG